MICHEFLRSLLYPRHTGVTDRINRRAERGEAGTGSAC
jgi:hypothetical protein